MLPAKEGPIDRLGRAFDTDWNRNAVPLTKELIARYKKRRPTSLPANSYTKGELADILGVEPSRRMASPEIHPRRFWRDCISDYAGQRTIRIVSESTNWDDRGFDWYTPGGKHPYEIGDQILLFDFARKLICVVEVKDIARTKVQTPDGRHFVAFKQVRKLSRRFSKSLWNRFKSESIDKSSARDRRELRPVQAERLIKVLMKR